MMESALNIALQNYSTALGDDSLVLGHRLSEWCRNGPFLEEDLALTNVSLDFIGRARMFYSYAAGLDNDGRSEDDIAYLRDCREYRNLLINELPNGDFAFTMARQLIIDVYDMGFFTRLALSEDSTLAAIAAKAVKESRYHLRRSEDWVKRLGDGTEESHERVQHSIDNLWRYTGEMFAADEVDTIMEKVYAGPNLESIHKRWQDGIEAILINATLTRPEDGWMDAGGKAGRHSEHLGYMIAEMQYLQRTHPGASW